MLPRKGEVSLAKYYVSQVKRAGNGGGNSSHPWKGPKNGKTNLFRIYQQRTRTDIGNLFLLFMRKLPGEAIGFPPSALFSNFYIIFLFLYVQFAMIGKKSAKGATRNMFREEGGGGEVEVE